jgi:hypothetical protein
MICANGNLMPRAFLVASQQTNLCRRRSLVPSALLAVCLALAIPGVAQAASGYELRAIVRCGDRAGDLAISADGTFEVGPLNEQGQLCFTADDPTGEKQLIQYADGRFTLLAGAGKQGPAGPWPNNLWFYAPVSMNRSGSVLFSGLLTRYRDRGGGATFLWEAATRQLSPVMLPGMPSVPGQSFEWAAGSTPALNNQGDSALVANVRNAAGQQYAGVFFRGRDGHLQPVALPDQALPDGGTIRHAWLPSLNDAGIVALLVRRQGEEWDYPYVWEAGTLRALPVGKVPVPPGALFFGFTSVWLNNQNRNALLAVHFHTLSSPSIALYLLAGGQLLPVAVPGQAMPGGGRLDSLQEWGVSVANEQGQHALLARLRDGKTAAYLMEPNGHLTLILKSGETTNLGRITQVGTGEGESRGIGLNSRGQVALTVHADRAPDTLALLTPLHPH